jgi:hypothetical protein
VFAAWLGHNDIKCLNTVDSLVRVNGVSFLRHHLIDFGASLGSDSFTTKSPRAGYEYLFRWRPTLAQVFSVGFYVPKWARADYPHFSSVGNFEYEIFEPEEWKPNYPATIFDNRLPEDNFWAARQVMWFTDEEIRAVVKTGEYSDSRAEEWMAECLIERRYKIGKAYFSASLPLDRFRVEQGRLAFDDLGVSSGFTPPRNYTVLWSSFDNNTEKHSRIDGTRGTTLPPEIQQATAGSYFAARITLDDEARSVTVFLRRTKAGVDIVGVERTT